MRRLSRLRPSIDRLQPPRSQSGYQCLCCHLQSSPFSTSIRNGKQVRAVEDQAGEEKSVVKLAEKSVDLPPVPEMITPATTWDNLPWIATPHWIEMKRAATIKVETFGNVQRPLTDRQAIKDAFMQSIVEVILLQGRHDSLQKLSDIQTAYRWPKDIALGLEDSKPVVKFPSEAVKEYLWEVLATGVEPEPSETEKDTSEPFNFEPLSAESPAAETLGAPSTKTQPSTTRKQALKRGSIDFFDPESDTAASQAQAVTFLKGNDGNSSSWEDISIADPKVKFTLYKRILQRTGIRLPDHSIAQAATAGALFDLLWRPPPPTKLADQIAMKSELTKIPNITVSPRRVGMMEKETAIGRWKIIEQELLDRGLPVSGPAL